MDKLQFPRATQMREILGNLQSRSEHVAEVAAKHLRRWREVTSQLEVTFTFQPDSVLSGSGEILGKKFQVDSQLVSVGADVFAEVLITTMDIVSGEKALVESYLIDSLRQVRSPISHTEITIDGIDDTSVIEYRAICESLYAVASWSSSHPRTPITSSQRVV